MSGTYKEVIMRGGRSFEYRRIGGPTMAPLGLGRLLWLFKTTGVMEDGELETIGNCNINVMLVSAITEEQAVEVLRSCLNPEGIKYDASLWDLELVGLDVREGEADPILYTGVSNV